VLTAQPVGLLLTARELLLHTECHFDRKRRHRLDDDIADCRIEPYIPHIAGGISGQFPRLKASELRLAGVFGVDQAFGLDLPIAQ